MRNATSIRNVILAAALVLAVVWLTSEALARAPEEWSRPLEVGEKAPDFILVNNRGDQIQLSGYGKGKYVVLDFYIGWF